MSSGLLNASNGLLNVVAVTLFADAAISIEVGPALAALLGTLGASSFAAFMSWLAFRRADEARLQGKENAETIRYANTEVKNDLGSIHSAVNSNHQTMTEELADTRAQLLEVSKLLAASQTTQVLGGIQSSVPGPVPVTVVPNPGNPLPVDVVEKEASEPEQRK